MSDSLAATNPSHRGYPYFPGYFWDHYTEHPDIYDRFAMSTDAGVDWLASLVRLSGDVLDMASGTGRTAFCAARRASSVVGIEPAAPMRTYAIRKRDQIGAVNVEEDPLQVVDRVDAADLIGACHAGFALRTLLAKASRFGGCGRVLRVVPETVVAVRCGGLAAG